MFYIIVYRANGPVEFESFKNTIILDMEKTEDKLNNSWFPGIINVFADKNSFVSPKAEKLDSFFDCVTTLISNQVKKIYLKFVLFSIIKKKLITFFTVLKFFIIRKNLKESF